MSLIRPPITGDAQLDSWTNQLTQQINKGILPGVGGSGSSSSSGPQGVAGADGNTAIYLYTRTSSATPVPDRPTSVQYDLTASPVSITATGGAGWSSTPPDFNGLLSYLWVTFRYVADRQGTISGVSSWDVPVLLGIPGEGALTVQLSVRQPTDLQIAAALSTDSAASGYDPTTWRFANGGQFLTRGLSLDTSLPAEQRRVVLLASVYLGGTIHTVPQHQGFTYQWNKNGVSFTPSISAGNPTNRRWLLIDDRDVIDGSTDQFICVVDTN